MITIPWWWKKMCICRCSMAASAEKWTCRKQMCADLRERTSIPSHGGKCLHWQSTLLFTYSHFLSNTPNHIQSTHPSKTTQTNLLSSPLGLPLVRLPPNSPIPPPHPSTPRHVGSNLEHRILQRAPLSLPTHLLGENPASPHSQLRRRPAALPPRAVAQSLRRPGQPLAAECDCSGGRSAVFDAVGGE